MRRTARTSSKATVKGNEASRPGSPPVPDEAFWSDSAQTDNSAWLATLATAPSDISADSLTEAPPTAEPAAGESPRRPVTPASPFATLNDWVEPVEIAPVAAAAPPAGYAPPPAPVEFDASPAEPTPAVDAVVPESEPQELAAPEPAAPAVYEYEIAAPGTSELETSELEAVVAEIAAPGTAAAEAAVVETPAEIEERPEIDGTDDDEHLIREVMFSPVPAPEPAPAFEVAELIPTDNGEPTDPYAWMDATGFDDLLPER